MCELLAPVRDETSLTAAIQAGADAVYFGLGTLNMRNNSKGIEPKALSDIVKKAHESGVKAYITLNTIVYDEELALLDELLDTIKAANADAIICSDFAVIQKARQRNIQIHISTQANISNIEAVKFFASLGAERVVLARELNLKQIKTIKDQSPIEIETFVHGAMCISVSGRCYMSEHLFGASANRGNCYQPCRREYKIWDIEDEKEMTVGQGYVMSPKDLCALPILDKLIDAGIDCFKIEGRSRSPEYIKTVTSVYRQAIDSIKAGCFDDKLKERLMDELKKVYNRGFSTGFYLGAPANSDYAQTEGSIATETKVAIGKIINYYPNIGVAYASIQASPISIGDKVQIHGPTTGVLEFEITDLRDTQKNQHQTIEKGKATFPCSEKVRMNDKLFKIISGNVLGLVLLFLAMLAGCTNNPGFIARDGSYFGAINKMQFTDINDLGRHRRYGETGEKNGMVYTCKGGYIDLGHLREAADRTEYLANLTYENLMKNKTEFSFQVIDPSWYFVTFKYPSNWENLPDKEAAAKDISIRLGQYFAFKTTTWHEISTWFGYKKNGIFSEYISSFSWEDQYSDLLGTILAERAMRDTGHNFNDTMTILLSDELKKLGNQPPKTGRTANKKIHEKWYSGDDYFWVVMNKRNFDIGVDDGFVTPWLVPGICQNAKPVPYPAPSMDFLSKYGITIKFELEPREMEKNLMLRIIYPDGKGSRLEPAIHFPAIINTIKKQAVEKYGTNVNKPNL
jgi:putative protease